MKHRRKLENIYRQLYAKYGPQHWWPARSRWEIMVGAVLTQNTSWRNVEYALAELKRADRLALPRMRALSTRRLAQLIRSAGYYNGKAKTLKRLAAFVERKGGDPAFLARLELTSARGALLSVRGIGPETADAILLYAAGHPIFVVDAMTRRIMARLGLTKPDAKYEALQAFFMAELPQDAALFNEYHALLVALGKQVCTRRDPRCGECPLRRMCPRIGV